MKRLELLINMTRRQTGNKRYDANNGLNQSVMTQYYQNAQDALVKALSIAKCKFGLKTTTAFAVSNAQQFVDYPSDLLLRNIDTIEWNLSGDLTNEGWIPLYKCISKDRYSSRVGYPYGYILQEDQIVLTPPVQGGYMRIAYVRTPRNLQVRMGQISAVTVTGSDLTALTIDPNEASFNPIELNEQLVLCVFGADGTTKAANIPFTSVDTTTGVFTISSHALSSGESVTVGDYVGAGEYVVNKPEWQDIVESYLIKWANTEAKLGDSSNWTKETKDDMQFSMAELIQCFALMSDDVTDVPIINADYLDIW